MSVEVRIEVTIGASDQGTLHTVMQTVDTERVIPSDAEVAIYLLNSCAAQMKDHLLKAEQRDP